MDSPQNVLHFFYFYFYPPPYSGDPVSLTIRGPRFGLRVILLFKGVLYSFSGKKSYLKFDGVRLARHSPLIILNSDYVVKDTAVKILLLSFNHKKDVQLS